MIQEKRLHRRPHPTKMKIWRSHLRKIHPEVKGMGIHLKNWGSHLR